MNNKIDVVLAHIREDTITIKLDEELREKLKDGQEIICKAIDLESKVFLNIKIQDHDKIPFDMRREAEELYKKLSEAEKAYQDSLKHQGSSGSLFAIKDTLEWTLNQQEELDLRAY